MSCKHGKCCECTKNRKLKYKEENEKDDKNELTEKILYIISVLIFILTFIPMIPNAIKIAMYLITLLLSGYELFLEGIKNIFHFRFEEETLMTIAAVAACCLGDFREACLVILLFCLGEFIEDFAVEKSNKHVQNIVEMKVDVASRIIEIDNIKDKESKENITQEILNLQNKNTILNEIEEVQVEDLKISDKILVKPGEMIPVDCIVLSGKSTLDTSRLTGESEPKEVEDGMEVLSGNINLNGSLVLEVIREYKDSTASQIIDLVYEATNNKGKTEKFITRFSKIYTPTVMILAIAIALIPIIIGLDAKTWITRALVFLVASCPCSIVISIPLAFFSCLGVLSKKGLLVKGTKHIENLAKAKTICFDKTGTITTGKMEIDEVKIYENIIKNININNKNHKNNKNKANDENNENNDLNKKIFFSYIYSLEHLSNHPIAKSIEKEIEKQGYNKNELLKEVLNQEEIPGYGLKGTIEGKEVLVGNIKLLDKYNISYPKEISKSGIYLVVDNNLLGYIKLKEELRNGLENLKQKLNKLGLKRIAILTGDNKEKAEKVAKQIGNVEVYSNLLPKDKLEKVEEFKKENKVIFVGDGINDSPVLAAANFSISIGEGTEIASNTADSILISNKVSIIPELIRVAKFSMKIVYSNIVFSLLTKVIVLALGIMGYAPIWLAVFADVGVTLITVLNSIRIYRFTV